MKNLHWAANASVSEAVYENGSFSVVRYSFSDYLGDMKTVLPSSV